MQQHPGLDSLPSEDFLQWFASFAIERGNLRNSHNGRLAFYAPHPLFERRRSPAYLFSASQAGVSALCSINFSSFSSAQIQPEFSFAR
jgi:hypothetical protein